MKSGVGGGTTILLSDTYGLKQSPERKKQKEGLIFQRWLLYHSGCECEPNPITRTHQKHSNVYYSGVWGSSKNGSTDLHND